MNDIRIAHPDQTSPSGTGDEYHHPVRGPDQRRLIGRGSIVQANKRGYADRRSTSPRLPSAAANLADVRSHHHEAGCDGQRLVVAQSRSQ